MFNTISRIEEEMRKTQSKNNHEFPFFLNLFDKHESPSVMRAVAAAE